MWGVGRISEGDNGNAGVLNSLERGSCNHKSELYVRDIRSEGDSGGGEMIVNIKIQNVPL